MEIHQVPINVPFLPDEDGTTGKDGGLYGPSSPGPTPTITGDGATVTAVAGFGEATAPSIGTDTAAGVRGMAAAAPDVNAVLNAAAA